MSSSQIRKQMRAELANRFPLCFLPKGSTNKKPLKIGIHRDVIVACPDLDPRHIKLGIKDYVCGWTYTDNVIEGAVRIGLGGEPAGVVTARHAAHAAVRSVRPVDTQLIQQKAA